MHGRHQRNVAAPLEGLLRETKAGAHVSPAFSPQVQISDVSMKSLRAALATPDPSAIMRQLGLAPQDSPYYKVHFSGRGLGFGIFAQGGVGRPAAADCFLKAEGMSKRVAG